MILIDTHVHIYSCFDLNKFFIAAHENFSNSARRIGCQGKFTAILILTDWSGQSWFDKIRAAIGNPEGEPGLQPGPWEWHRTEEGTSIYFEDLDGNRIYLMAGRKIITQENLEVLALTSEDRVFKDGDPLLETVQTILQHDSIPVIPWAAGKWLGRRGAVLDQVMARIDPKKYFLCDNGNRPFFWAKPKHFVAFQEKGGRLLSGSDPLHFPSETGRAGSFGCWVKGNLDLNFPTRWLKSVLHDPETEIHLYGAPETALRFLHHQVMMQLFKSKWKNAYYKK